MNWLPVGGWLLRDVDHAVSCERALGDPAGRGAADDLRGAVDPLHHPLPLLLFVGRVLGQVVEELGERQSLLLHFLRVQDGARPLVDDRPAPRPRPRAAAAHRGDARLRSGLMRLLDGLRVVVLLRRHLRRALLLLAAFAPAAAAAPARVHRQLLLDDGRGRIGGSRVETVEHRVEFCQDHLLRSRG